MKIGQFRKINQFFGIAKITQENEEWFVIYYNKFDALMQNELGDLIGKGKTEADAFSSALLNLYKDKKSIEEILKKIQALHISIENHHPVIFPMKLYRSSQDQESDAHAEEFTLVNAGVFLEDKQAVLFPTA